MAKKKAPAAAGSSAPDRATDEMTGSPASTDPGGKGGAKVEAKSGAGTDTGKAATAAAAKPARKRWFRATVLVLFGLLYAWDLFEAISNMFGKLDELAKRNEVRTLNGFPPIDVPWVYLLANLLLPVVVFGLAILVSRKRNVGILAIVLLAGLGVVAAVSLTLVAIVLRVA